MKKINIFRLLLWNHAIYYLRQWHIAALTVLLQPVGFLIFTYLRSPLNIGPKTKTTDVFHHPMTFVEKMTKDMQLFYAPHTDASDIIMQRIKEYYKPLIMKGFPTEAEMIASMYGNEDYVGIVFDNLPTSCSYNISNDFPKNFHYRIRTRMDPKSLTSTMSAHEWPFRATAKEIYFRNFLGVQHAIDMSFIRAVIEETNKSINVNISLQEMPYPPHEVYTHTVYLNYYVFILFLATNGVQVFFFTVAMAQEISSRMNTMLYGMGMTTWMYWIKWLLHCFIPQQLSVALLILIIFHDMPYSQNALLENTNAFLIFCCLFSYSFSLIATCFCCVTCFSMMFNETHHVVIALMSTVFWFSHPMVLFFVSYNNPYTNQILKYLILLLPNVCVYLGIFVIAQYEQMGGLRWSQFFTGVSTLTSYPSIGILMVMLTIDALLYFLVAWYLYEVIPSEYKVHQSWNFFYRNFISRKKKKIQKTTDCYVPVLDKSAIMEEPSKSSVPIIQVRNLNKAFGEARQIITDLNVDIFENQLTVILSKEKDAKSTMLSTIAGNVPTATYNRFIQNIKSNFNEMVANISLNLLSFNRGTVLNFKNDK